MAVLPPVKLPVAPLPGTVKVTVATFTGFPPASFTDATIGLAKAVPSVALWPEPLVSVMVEAAPTVFVREKVAGVATGETVALTV